MKIKEIKNRVIYFESKTIDKIKESVGGCSDIAANVIKKSCKDEAKRLRSLLKKQ